MLFIFFSLIETFTQLQWIYEFQHKWHLWSTPLLLSCKLFTSFSFISVLYKASVCDKTKTIFSDTFFSGNRHPRKISFINTLVILRRRRKYFVTFYVSSYIFNVYRENFLRLLFCSISMISSIFPLKIPFSYCKFMMKKSLTVFETIRG